MMEIGSPARFSIATAAVGWDSTPTKELARAKMEMNEVFMVIIATEICFGD